MGKSNDKKAKREVKEEKNLALGVKRKQLKRKKDRGLDRADDGAAAKNGAKEDKELARRKKMALMKRKKKNKQTDVGVELMLDNKDDAVPKLKKKTKKKTMKSGSPVNNKDDAMPKLKKKTKKKTMKSGSPVKDNESPFVSDYAETPKLKKKKRKVKEGKSTAELTDAEEILHENQDNETQRDDVNQLAAHSEDMDNVDSEKAKRGKKKTKKIKKSGKANKSDKYAASKQNDMGRHVEVSAANVDGTADVDEIPSVDEDCSKGMKKWILEYKEKRPGLKILQERIDEFIIAHEEQQEKERKEREAAAAEEGWTVVVHHKGRKKTTDAETGTAVGSVSLAAMQEKMANKKPKEDAPNFYRFQKREAHLSELAMLQSKFEQDKKRIQELRAQRKFKPY